MNIAQGLVHAKKISGTRQAVVCGETRYTWEDFDQRTDALARGLANLGMQRGDRLAVLMLNCHRYLELYYACARMGAVIVPLNIRLARPEIVYILNDSESKALVVDKTFASYAVGRDTFPTVESVVFSGDETPAGMICHQCDHGNQLHRSRYLPARCPHVPSRRHCLDVCPYYARCSPCLHSFV